MRGSRSRGAAANCKVVGGAANAASRKTCERNEAQWGSSQQGREVVMTHTHFGPDHRKQLRYELWARVPWPLAQSRAGCLPAPPPSFNAQSHLHVLCQQRRRTGLQVWCAVQQQPQARRLLPQGLRLIKQRDVDASGQLGGSRKATGGRRCHHQCGLAGAIWVGLAFGATLRGCRLKALAQPLGVGHDVILGPKSWAIQGHKRCQDWDCRIGALQQGRRLSSQGDGVVGDEADAVEERLGRHVWRGSGKGRCVGPAAGAFCKAKGV
jgi:hypothetical protein